MKTAVQPAEENAVSQDVIARAQAAVEEFYSDCLWFRHPKATIRNAADVRNIIRHLREYGGWKAWYTAQDLQKCL